MLQTITFILPGPGDIPVGGYKIVFEYANRMVAEGKVVHVVFPATLLFTERSLPQKFAGAFRYALGSMFRRVYEPHSWFPLDPRVRVHWVPALTEAHIPDADVVVATAAETAEYVKDYGSTKGRKFYFIQHFEDWSMQKERVLRTWQYPLRKIVIAEWLARIANDLSQPYDVVHNGLDFERFGVDVPIEQKNKQQIVMLYHRSEWKGSAVGLRALEEVHRQRPETAAVLFGATRTPSGLPGFVRYHAFPDQRKLRAIYNDSAVYLGSSFGEGWGLTIAEAMQCGCAVVCTNVDGYNEMAIDGKTALSCSKGDWQSLAKNIIRLIDDDQLRIQLATEGNRFIQRFTWTTAYEKFLSALERDTYPT